MTRKPIDDREWRLQEAARRGDARGASRFHATGNDDDARALARYRAIDGALRDLAPPALPADFAAQVAGIARTRAAAASVAAPDGRLERWLLPALLVAMALATLVVVVVFGGEWWRSAGSALGASAPGWIVAAAACAALSFGADRVAAALAGSRGARPAG